jgi:hypothetical protein
MTIPSHQKPRIHNLRRVDNGDEITIGQIKMIQLQMMNAGIKGENPQEIHNLSKFIAIGIIDKLVRGMFFGGMKELESNGIRFTEEDWEIAREM